jgi:4-hydroxy-tetrahydrodipicolinate reductase
MGCAVADLAAAADDVELAGAIEPRKDRSIGWAQAAGLPVLSTAPERKPGTVVIDFTRAGALGPLLEILKGSGLPLVCGTTGFEGGERDLLYVYSEETPVFYAENMSYGICVLAKLLRENGPLLDPFLDVEIVEFHHRHKRDCPSGTALALADALGKSEVIRGRGPQRETTGNSIHIHSVRAGGIPGTHEVHFAAEEEVVTFTHRALSRDVFARGALRAARFVAGKDHGLFGMNDLTEAHGGTLR